MKKLILTLVMVAGMSQAAYIKNATFDSKTDEVVLDVVYGGCHLNDFKLNFGERYSFNPEYVKTTLDDSQDNCRAIVHEEVRFGLEEITNRPSELVISTIHGGPSVQVSIPLNSELGTKTIKVTRTGLQFRIDSVNVVIEGEHGFPSSHVYATATFGNKCAVPHADELLSTVQHGNNFNTLNIVVLNLSTRVCPLNYLPTPVVLDLGVHTKPNDGLFSKVLVNGVLATK